MYISIPFAIFFSVLLFVGGFIVACIVYAGKDNSESTMWVVRDDDPESNQFGDNTPKWKLVEKEESTHPII